MTVGLCYSQVVVAKYSPLLSSVEKVNYIPRVMHFVISEVV